MSYHDAFRNGLEQSFSENPSAVKVYLDILRDMKKAVYKRDYIDIVVQRSSSKSYDIYDAWVFAQIHCIAQAGDIQILRVDLGHEPTSDKEAAQNNAALATLPSPFRATFHGGLGDCDGDVTWTETIIVDNERWEPRSVPLEVGTTRSASTWLHLCRYRWLSRWPYGSEAIYIMQWKQEAWRKSAAQVWQNILPKKFRNK